MLTFKTPKGAKVEIEIAKRNNSVYHEVQIKINGNYAGDTRSITPVAGKNLLPVTVNGKSGYIQYTDDQKTVISEMIAKVQKLNSDAYENKDECKFNSWMRKQGFDV